MTKPKTANAKRGAAAMLKAPKDYKNPDIRIPATSGAGQDIAAAVAKQLTRPEVCAAAVIENWQKDTHDVNELVSELARQVEAVNSGDLRRAEGVLIAQAHALDNIFANLARRATNQTHLTQWEAYMRMAMRAQNQCRMTLESLANIKNPPVVFARQANIAHGPQQVNNGLAQNSDVSASDAWAKESEIAQNRLLEGTHGERLDGGAQGAASGANPQLAPVGAFNRPAQCCWQGEGITEFVERRNPRRPPRAGPSATPAKATAGQPRVTPRD